MLNKFKNVWADVSRIEYAQDIGNGEVEIGMDSGRTFLVQATLEEVEAFYREYLANLAAGEQ